MKLIWNPARQAPCVLVLGMFDGVHRGHQALLLRGREIADSLGLPLCVCTFEPHPLAVLIPQRAPRRLTSQGERARLMALYGADELCVHRFTRELAAMPPEDFLAVLKETYHPAVAVCGFNFTFGREGRGNGSLLRSFASAHGFSAEVIPEVVLDGATVSSTRVRRCLEAGDIREVSRLLGHAWTLCGAVEDGKHIGRSLGFPTANVHIPAGKALPAFGVYACCLTDEDGQHHRAVVNVGRHPTLPDGPETVEAYVLGETLALYGRHVRLTFFERLRPEIRFDTVAELRSRIAADAEQARRLFDAWR